MSYLKPRRILGVVASMGLALSLTPGIANAQAGASYCTAAPLESIPAFSIPADYPVYEGWSQPFPDGADPIDPPTPNDPDVPLIVPNDGPVYLRVNTIYQGDTIPVPTSWKVKYPDDTVEEASITYEDVAAYKAMFDHDGTGGRSDFSYSNMKINLRDGARELHVNGGTIPLRVKNGVPIQVTTKPGVAPTLPNEVLVRCNNGSTAMAPVTWDPVKPEAYENPTGEGSPVEITGKVEGVNYGHAYLTVEEPDPTPTPTPTPGVGSAVLPGLGALALLHSAATGSSGSQGGPAAPNADVKADQAANTDTAPTKGVAPQQEAKRTAVLANTGAESNQVLAAAALLSIVGVSIFAFATRRRA